MTKNKQYYLVSKLKQEEKEREKHNLEVMKANEDFYRQHILEKKDNNNHFPQAGKSKVEDDKVNQENQENKPTKNKKIKELQSFLGYKNRTAFCIAHNYQLFKLNACIDKLKNDKQEINEKNIASYMKAMNDKADGLQQQVINLIADEKYKTKTIKKQQEDIKKLQDKLDKLEVRVDKLQQQLTGLCKKLCDIFLIYGKNKK
jgi:hypothetical protein